MKDEEKIRLLMEVEALLTAPGIPGLGRAQGKVLLVRAALESEEPLPPEADAPTVLAVVEGEARRIHSVSRRFKATVEFDCEQASALKFPVTVTITERKP